MGERTFHTKDFEHFEIEDLLGEKNLLGTVSKLPHFMPQIVHELYVNLSKDIGEPASPNFQWTIVRGHSFEFFPSIINHY